MKLTSASIDQLLSSMYESGKSPNSIRAYRADLMGLLGWMDETQPVGMQAAIFLNTIRDQCSPRTIQRKLAAFRAWGKFHGDPEFLAGYKAPVPPPAMPHPLKEGIEGILTMYGHANTAHHKALVVLCGMFGLRVGEARSVRVMDFDVTSQTLLVQGKGRKFRYVPYSEKTWALIQGPYLVAAQDGGEKARLVPLSDRGARAYYARLAKRVLGADSSSHDMRATFATATFERTKNLRATQELLGHANNQTTEIYTGVSEAARRDAVEII